MTRRFRLKRQWSAFGYWLNGPPVHLGSDLLKNDGENSQGKNPSHHRKKHLHRCGVARSRPVEVPDREEQSRGKGKPDADGDNLKCFERFKHVLCDPFGIRARTSHDSKFHIG